MKTIVTHMSPDLDAIASSWLIKTYLPGWSGAEQKFVPAGETYENKKPDENPDIIHVDTGLGKFDHHQFSERLSATKRVFEYLLQEGFIKEKDLMALEKMVKFITEIDNFGEVHFPDPTDVKYSFMLYEFIYPLRGRMSSDLELSSMVMLILDSILYTIKNELHAEEEIKQGAIIKSSLGKTLVMENRNEASMKYALKKGFEVVVRRDPETGSLRIKTFPSKDYDLTELYEKIIKVDKNATWFLHASKNMLLNGSSKNPNSVPSTLSLKEIIELIRKI